MTGDQNDMVSRLKAVMPNGWFPDATPILDGVLTGCANAWSWCYGLIATVRLQARRLTASGPSLDMISADFFNAFLPRRTGETDALFNGRIGKELFRQKVTRFGMIQALTDLTARAPRVFEPAYPLDTGGYGVAMGYGAAGGYGSLGLPFQFFVTAFRPSGQGVANVAGYGTIGGFNGMPGGYGVGAIEYANPSMFVPPVTDQMILDVINDVRPVATIAWTNLSN